MVTYFCCGYIVKLGALEKMALDRAGKTVPITEVIRYYVTQTRQALEPSNDLGEGFDLLFSDTELSL